MDLGPEISSCSFASFQPVAIILEKIAFTYVFCSIIVTLYLFFSGVLKVMLDLGKLPDLDKTDYKPLYIQLSEMLEDYIMAQEISPETPLPSEKDLMDRCL